MMVQTMDTATDNSTDTEYEQPDDETDNTALDDDSQDDSQDESDSDSSENTREPVNALSMSDEEFMQYSAGQPPELPAKSGTDTDTNTNTDTDTDKQSNSKSSSADERDIAAEHAQIFSPIKAGGKEIQIKNVDEAISLMQKGADYHRKTEQIAAHMKTVKTLERAGIQPDDLNYLIALHNKEPEAIRKLLADAKIDPLDIDIDEQASNYTPKNYTISDGDLALEDTLDSLKASPTYNQLLQVVGSEWDDSSRQFVANNPALMPIINEHMSNGIYAVIAEEVARQRALGQLSGVNDLTAYQQVGEMINEQGGFNHLITDEQRAARKASQPGTQKISRPRQKASNQELNAKRRAASPTKGVSATRKAADTTRNPLSLSDEEFMRQFGSMMN